VITVLTLALLVVLSPPSALHSTDPSAAQDLSATVTVAAPIFVAPDVTIPLRVAAPNTVLRVLKEEGDWVQVEFQDPQYGRRVGWVKATSLRIMRPELQPMDLSIRDPKVNQSKPIATQGTPGIPSNVDPAISPRRNRQTREGVWFNVGLGAGSLGREECSGRSNGLSGGLSVGGRINDKWLVGVGTTGFAKSVLGETLSVGTLDARFRFYPVHSSGFFLTGGLGLGSLSFAGESEFGAGAILGLGWDIRVGRNVSLTPFYSGFAMKSSLANANVGQLGIGVTIH
jgi:hypothetical protein